MNIPHSAESLRASVSTILPVESGLSDSANSETGHRRTRDLATVRKLGRYELKRLVGRGGFGEVWLGVDVRLGREVAIKLPLFSRADEKRTKRFLSEAKASASLRHPNIVAVYDAGEIDGQLYLATEFAEGQVLSEVNEGRPLSERQAAQIVAGLAEALDYAHSADVIHRDLKPHNVMLDPRGEPQLLDFGLAKRLGDASQTIDGSILGTPAYMSPEQACGAIQKVGKSSDQYSLGVILYRLLAGRTPFQGPPAAVLQQVLVLTPPPLTEFAPNVDSRLVAICEKARQAEPQDRYATCGDFAEDLRRFLNDEPVRAAPLSRIAAAVRWVQKHRRDAALSGVAGLLASALFGISLIGFSRAFSDAEQAAESKEKAQVETERLVQLQSQLESQLQEVEAAKDAATTALSAEAKSLELVNAETTRLQEATEAVKRAKQIVDEKETILAEEAQRTGEMTAKVDQLPQLPVLDLPLNAYPPSAVYDPRKSRSKELPSKEALPAAYQRYFDDPEFVENLERELRTARTYVPSHLVIAKIDSGDVPPGQIMTQSPITRQGIFISAVNNTKDPIGFWHDGFDSVEVVPQGGGLFEDLGTIQLKPLDPSLTGTVAGRVGLVSPTGTPLNRESFNWKLAPLAANHAKQGQTNHDRWTKDPINWKAVRAGVSADGSFQDFGFVPGPARYGLFYDNIRLTKDFNVSISGKISLGEVRWPTALIRYQAISSRQRPLHPIAQIELPLGTDWVLDIPQFGRLPFITANLCGDGKVTFTGHQGTLKMMGDGSVAQVDKSKLKQLVEKSRSTSLIEPGKTYVFARSSDRRIFVLCEFTVKVGA